MTRFVSTLALGAVLTAPATAQVEQAESNVPQYEPAFDNQTRAPAVRTEAEVNVETVADGLEHPWGIEVLPDGSYLVTERPGRLRHVTRNGDVADPIAGVPDVRAAGQGGLLDVHLAPDFDESRVIYITYAKPVEGGSATAAARATLSRDMSALEDVRDIFVQEPAVDNAMHFGSRVLVEGDYAYVTTGERYSQTYREYAQDFDATFGKIVRVTTDGEVPPDNPFVDQEGTLGEIWTLGHRNIQGADFHPETGQLWALEHGPAGGDEINIVEPGQNYGWPIVSYGRQYQGPLVGIGEPRREGLVEPRYYWDPVIAPGGFAFYDGEMFSDWQGDVLASSLYPGGLVRLTMEGDTVTGEERLLTDIGRVRDVEVDRDGGVLLLTDQPDGAILRVTTGG